MTAEGQEGPPEKQHVDIQNLDVRFISSLPVKRHPVCMAWVDTKPAQMAWAEG
jgi:hypothetical protein